MTHSLVTVLGLFLDKKSKHSKIQFFIPIRFKFFCFFNVRFYRSCSLYNFKGLETIEFCENSVKYSKTMSQSQIYTRENDLDIILRDFKMVL